MYHPELRKNEFFIANTKTINRIPKQYRHLKTVRLGKQAYCIKGKKLDQNYMLPFFVSKSDYKKLNKIWQDRINAICR